MMTIYRALALTTILTVLPMNPVVVALDDDDDKSGISREGYISNWLVLAPIPLADGEEGPSGLAKEQIKDEASLKPKANDKIELDGKEYVWKAAEAKDDVLNFNDFLGAETEKSVAYAVSVIVVEDDLSDVTLKVGSDDQVRIYLNGKQIHSNDEARPLEKDQDTIEGLTLKKGRNVLVMKVVNEGEGWEASVRIVDKGGASIPKIKATVEPE